MATPRDIRKIALQFLFQLDVRGEDDAQEILESVEAGVAEKDAAKAMGLATAAYRDRRKADEAVRELAPTWPAHRQPAIDRAILRLAHYEMTSGKTPAKVAVNEAVELAKRFGTERSPAFINGVLDKILRRVLKEQREKPEAPAPGAGDAPGGVPPVIEKPLTLRFRLPEGVVIEEAMRRVERNLQDGWTRDMAKEEELARQARRREELGFLFAYAGDDDLPAVLVVIAENQGGGEWEIRNIVPQQPGRLTREQYTRAYTEFVRDALGPALEGMGVAVNPEFAS